MGDVALSFQEVKALATGNPLLLEQARAEADLARLERLERAHAKSKIHLQGSIRANEQEINRLARLGKGFDSTIARRRNTRGDAFAMVVRGVATAERPEAETRPRRIEDDDQGSRVCRRRAGSDREPGRLQPDRGAARGAPCRSWS